MLALAAAGPALATEAGDDEAHQLLLFAVEACAMAPPGTAAKSQPARRWILAACVALAVLLLPLLYVRYASEHRPRQPEVTSSGAAHPGTPTDTISPSQAVTPPRLPETSKSYAPLVSPGEPAAGRAPAWLPGVSVRTNHPGTPSAPLAAANTSRSVPAMTAAPAQPTASLVRPANTAGTVAVPANLPPLQRSPAIATPVPSSVLSKRLDARTLPPEYASDAPRTYPRLLRRRPLLPLEPDSDGSTPLLAANETPSGMITTTPGRPVSAGTVRPVSLGVMAANVLYSPAPAYPPAAAAAHVQGQVTVQAEVDRDGNVAAARVVSGPLLLRDAAVDAVQRWRYRPYRSAGKAVSANATAVVEFELP